MDTLEGNHWDILINNLSFPINLLGPIAMMPACIESHPPHFIYKRKKQSEENTCCCKKTSHLWRGRISTILVWLGFRKLKLSLSRSQRDRWRLELHSCTSTFEHFEHTWTQVPESLAYLNTSGLNFFLTNRFGIISRHFTLLCSQTAEKQKEAGATFFQSWLVFPATSQANRWVTRLIFAAGLLSRKQQRRVNWG